MFDFLNNLFFNHNRYRVDSEAVIISCFFNPQNSPYRLLAFQKWYHSIKHMNHRILECLIGDDAHSQLPKSPYITQVHADTLLFHKEALLNKIVEQLPEEFKYVFWVDADVLFTNKDWLVEGTQRLRERCSVVQPFEYCIHLERNQIAPTFDVNSQRWAVSMPERRHKSMWRSFAAVQCLDHASAKSENYDRHGHVGFAWGARREVLENCPFYELAVVGGADHILAHAAVGEIPHSCITKGFADNINNVEAWSKEFFAAAKGKIGYVPGDLYHIWHGDIAKRQYLKRVQDFTGPSKDLKRDKNGFYATSGKNATYVKNYYRQREVGTCYYDDFDGFDVGFYEDMGYMLLDVLQSFSQPSYDDDGPAPQNQQDWQDQSVPDANDTQDSSPQADQVPDDHQYPAPDSTTDVDQAAPSSDNFS
jgi:hypothetical protein